MIRVVLFLTAVGFIALGAAWFADRPGDVTINWLGYRIETSLMVLIGAVAAIAAASVLAWSLLRAILRSPDLISRIIRDRRGVRGYQAISRGMIAVGAGDSRAAKKHADEAMRLASSEPLTLLLSAQTAQLSGDRRAAERAFREMASRDDTKLIGLHGLFVEAQRRDDHAAARSHAEEAAAAAPSLTWAGEAVLAARYGEGDWAGALQRLDANLKGHLVTKNAYKRQRAVLLTARAMAVEEADRDAAIAFAQEAVKLQPDFVPAAALAGRLLAETGETRKAARVIEKAWRAHPHPDLADAYAQLRFGDSARERLSRIEQLSQKAPGDPESALALARAALDAHEFAKARNALAPLLDKPTRRVALLMAELEEREHADEGRARQWMARALHAARDPAWTADGVVSDHWMPVSPVSGRLDAFQWRVPLEELGEPKPAFEIEERAPAVMMAAILPADVRPVDARQAEARSGSSAEPARADSSTAPASYGQGFAGPASSGSVSGTARASDTLPVAKPSAAPGSTLGSGSDPLTSEAAGSPAAGSSASGAQATDGQTTGLGARRPRPQPAPERIIPLAHAPDDPGPDGEPEPDNATVVPLPAEAWRRTTR